MSSQSEKSRLEAEAEFVVEFVNTRDVEAGTDAIATAEGCSEWLGVHAEELSGIDICAEDHDRLLALRESLRALLSANNGGNASADQLTALREAADRSWCQTEFAADGTVEIDPVGDGGGALETRLLLAMERVQLLGGWERLKVCPAEVCQWAFYDSSRNHSRTWCSMEVCGNRDKVRRYRSQQTR